MDISDPAAQQRLLQGIQQQIVSINSANTANAGNTFQSQGANHPSSHQQQLIQQQIAAAQKQMQQQQIQGQSQLPNFIQNLSHYNYTDTNSNTPGDGTQVETPTNANSAAEIANNPTIKLILLQAQKHAIKDLMGN